MGSCMLCCKRARRPDGSKRLSEVREPELFRYNDPPPRTPTATSPVRSLESPEEPDVYEFLKPGEVVPEDAPDLTGLQQYENKNVWCNPYDSEEFVTYIQQQMRGRVSGLAKEFRSLDPSSSRYASDAAKSMDNRKKNTNVDFIPYDMSRVHLKGENDYINASVLPGVYREEQRYVVAQHPIVTAQTSTLGDFWQMVWEENIRCIVSLTPVGEGEKGAYWPKERNSEQVFASQVVVKLTAKATSELSTQRTFIVNLEEDKRKSFLLHHIELSADLMEKKCPSVNLILLTLTQQISDVICSKEKSAKLCFVSKTNNSLIGMLIALFELMKPIQEKSPFSVYQTVDALLDHRTGLITEFPHYQLLFVVVLEVIQALKPISLEDLREVQVGNIDPDSEEGSPVIAEYAKVDLFCSKAFISKPHKLADSSPNKGQLTNTFPYDDNIVALKECPSGCDYINASLIHMESGVCPIIAAVHPVKATLPEFFWMLMTSGVQLVLVLAKQQEIDHMVGGVIKSISYWSPSVFEKSFGNFHVLGDKPVEERGMLRYDVRVTYIEATKDKRVHRFQLYLYRDWDENDLPQDNTRCLELLQFIQEYREGKDGDKPVLLQSIDGSTKIGVLLAVMNGCLQVQGGEELDLPWVVKNLRCQRMKMVSCKEEYQKAYQLLKEFLATQTTYVRN